VKSVFEQEFGVGLLGSLRVVACRRCMARKVPAATLM
jgi:hypothetical protein